MSEQKTHAEIIAEMRFHGQLNIDAEQDKREIGALVGYDLRDDRFLLGEES